MHVDIAAAGRLRDAALQKLIERYAKRCHWRITILEKLPKGRQSECDLLLSAIRPGDRVLVLDERGRNLQSDELARMIGTWEDEGCARLLCLIGGADGLTREIRDRAHLIMAFGQATWPHMLVRLMLCEQLYRASTILRNHPYHRDG